MEKQLRGDLIRDLALLNQTELFLLTVPALRRKFLAQDGLSTYVSDIIIGNAGDPPLLTVLTFLSFEILLTLKNFNPTENEVKRLVIQLINNFEEFQTFVKEEFKDPLFTKVEQFEKEYNERVSGQVLGLIEKTDHIWEKLQEPAETAAILAAIGDLALSQEESFFALDEKVTVYFNNLEGQINSKFKDLDDKLDEIKKEIIQETSEEVCLKVLGVPYYRFKSNNTCYPTMIFNFAEDTVSNRRTCQIMARLNTKTKDLPPQEIERFKQLFTQIAPFSYRHGFFRGNFVSEKQNWKTTIFAYDQNEVIQILIKICAIVGEPFSEELVSFTTGRRRASKALKTANLDGSNLEQIEANFVYKANLTRVALILIKEQRPIILWKKS